MPCKLNSLTDQPVLMKLYTVAVTQPEDDHEGGYSWFVIFQGG